MAIEGPLREFSIHDVFQLLDMSRKTGMLRVTSPVRDDEVHVYFDGGKVVHATLGNHEPIEDLLVAAGRITPEELDQARGVVAQHSNGANLTDMFVLSGVVTAPELEELVRVRLETIVFDVMTWRDGFFSFEERSVEEIPQDARVSVATESLLMESARRIDEWSRIADKVPNLTVVPSLAPVADDHESQLDLHPQEWDVLTLVDGVRDVRAIATELGRDEFEVAKTIYGLASTGVVDVPKRRLSPVMSSPAVAPAAENPAIVESLELGFASVRRGDLRGARTQFERFLQLAPSHKSAPRARKALDAISALMLAMEADRV